MKKGMILAALLAGVLTLSACGLEETITEKLSSETTTETTEAETETETEAETEIETEAETEELHIVPGEYADCYSGRAFAIVTANEDGTGYNITIEWASSAFDSVKWTMTATVDGTKLNYDDCSCFYIESGEEGESTTETYVENTGYFEVEDGVLAWTGASDEYCRDCRFELSESYETD